MMKDMLGELMGMAEGGKNINHSNRNNNNKQIIMNNNCNNKKSNGSDTNNI